MFRRFVQQKLMNSLEYFLFYKGYSRPLNIKRSMSMESQATIISSISAKNQEIIFVENIGENHR